MRGSARSRLVADFKVRDRRSADGFVALADFVGIGGVLERLLKLGRELGRGHRERMELRGDLVKAEAAAAAAAAARVVVVVVVVLRGASRRARRIAC